MIIQGHRGCRGILPENTIPSFIKTIELGADGLELDIVVTQDKQLLVSHEPWMGAHICLSPKKKKTAHLVSSDFVYNIEIKSEKEWYGKFQPEPIDYASIILKEIQPLIKKGLSFILQSFDSTILNKLNHLAPDLTYGLLVERTTNPIEVLKQLNFTPTYLNPEHILLTPKLVKQTKELGLKIITWTVNNQEDFEKCQKLGIYGVITDYPNLYV